MIILGPIPKRSYLVSYSSLQLMLLLHHCERRPGPESVLVRSNGVGIPRGDRDRFGGRRRLLALWLYKPLILEWTGQVERFLFEMFDIVTFNPRIYNTIRRTKSDSICLMVLTRRHIEPRPADPSPIPLMLPLVFSLMPP
jgi:hypothetical protein